MENHRISIWGGTAISLLPTLPAKDLILTIIMATIGAITSFLVSITLKWIINKCK